ncbi:unnamed protein product [Closterium sp. Naga37s-1]|nr:unnamed protein product [Closterium sp. Naga37s-1]
MAAAVRQGRLSRQSLEQHYRSKCVQLNPEINAVCHLARATPTPPRLLPATPVALVGVNSETPPGTGASAADSGGSAAAAAAAASAVERPLEDLVHVAGLPTACGDEQLAAQPAPHTPASAVSLLQSLGAVPIGKSNVPHLSMDFQTFNSLFGVTNNPINRSLTTGGSSGGSAAAVAAGMVPFALGTDLEGSLRLPASFCGICSLRPSRDRWPVLAPDVPLPSLALLSSLHTYGVFTRTMQDLLFIMTAVFSRLPTPLRPSLPPQPPPLSPPPPLRVAVSPHLPGSPIDSRISRLFQALAATSQPATASAADAACLDAASAPSGSTCREQQQHQQQQQHLPQQHENGQQVVEFVLMEAPPRLDFRALDKASKAFIFAAHRHAPRPQHPAHSQGRKPGAGKSSKPVMGHAGEHFRTTKEGENAEAEREAERQQRWEAEVAEARRTQEQQQAVVEAFLSDNCLAAWILPVASVLPFAHNPQHSPLTIEVSSNRSSSSSKKHQQAAAAAAAAQETQQVPYPRALRSFTVPLSVTGHPVVSMPLGSVDGLPCGMQVVGHVGQDIPLLHLCCRIEEYLQQAGLGLRPGLGMEQGGTGAATMCSRPPLFARPVHSCL